jgi:hypothetical protein
MLLAVNAREGLVIRQFDNRNAFLNGVLEGCDLRLGLRILTSGRTGCGGCEELCTGFDMLQGHGVSSLNSKFSKGN